MIFLLLAKLFGGKKEKTEKLWPKGTGKFKSVLLFWWPQSCLLKLSAHITPFQQFHSGTYLEDCDESERKWFVGWLRFSFWLNLYNRFFIIHTREQTGTLVLSHRNIVYSHEQLEKIKCPSKGNGCLNYGSSIHGVTGVKNCEVGR